MDKRYSKKNNLTFNCTYRVVFCPKYRRKVLVDGIDKRCDELLHEKARLHEWEIINCEVKSDSVDIVIRATPNDAPNFIVSQLKTYTAFTLRNEFPHLKSQLPCLWTRRYYVETIGEETDIEQFLLEQKKR